MIMAQLYRQKLKKGKQNGYICDDVPEELLNNTWEQN